jgi:hypothetical protein
MDDEDNSTAETAEIIKAKTTAEAGANGAPQAVETIADELTAKYQGEGGAIDTGRVFNDLRELQKNYDGLRQKLSKAESPKKLTVEDFAEELGELEDDDDKEFAGRFIEMLGMAGVDKKGAKDLLKNLSELHPAEDTKEFARKEIEKLGKQGQETLAEVRRFYDGMKAQRDWAPEDLAVLEEVTQTADGVKLVAKILHSADRLRAGQFSTYVPDKQDPTNLSQRDKIAMYERAYAMRRSKPEEAQQEINRLDKIFEK